MTTLVLQTPGTFIEANDAALAEPAANEALVRVRAVGVCGTDFHAYAGRQPFFTYPRILGHEVGVEVVQLGKEVRHLTIGDRCSIEPSMSCGSCHACRRGKTNCCEKLRVIGVHVDGAMRSHFLVPASKLHPSRKLDFEQLALIETLGIGAHAVARAELKSDDTALIIGSGPIGLACLQFIRAIGAPVSMMDTDPHRLEALSGLLASKHVITASRDVAANVQLVRESLSGDLPTVVFDATGNLASMKAAPQYVAHGGRLTLVGFAAGEIAIDDVEFHKRELTLLGSRNSISSDFPRIITLVESGKVNAMPWVTHRTTAESAAGAFPAWTDPGSRCLKGIIRF
jgi:2-desacetyl-2-hydroxyethyl bacteriochlorophyllide A dehydrogenase